MKHQTIVTPEVLALLDAVLTIALGLKEGGSDKTDRQIVNSLLNPFRKQLGLKTRRK